MPVKMRLSRAGGKKNPFYHVVVADARMPRDGRSLDAVGRYDPRLEPSLIEIDVEKAKMWLDRGALPTAPVQKLLEIAGEHGIQYVADGASLDDASDHRPGMRAAAELGIVSPLKEAGLTKNDIRELSRMLGLPTWDKPSFACLASRFPYGEEITPEKLTMVDRAESFLRSLGFRQVRVRHHDNMARIEVPEADIPRFLNDSVRESVASKLKEIGYTYISLDLQGYRSGSMNEVLSQSERSAEKDAAG